MLTLEEARKRISDDSITEEEISGLYQLANILIDDYLKKKWTNNDNRTTNRSE